MRYLRLIVISLLLTVLGTEEARSFYSATAGTTAYLKGYTERGTFRKAHKEYALSKSPVVFKKVKKYKTKGVEVIVPRISSRNFVRLPEVHEELSFYVSNVYASFLYCVDRKRGPPFLS